MHYIATRKPRDRFCVLIVDEFSSLVQTASMAARVEKARGFLASLILAPQVVEGMGGTVETARILGSVETVIAHRVNTPDEIVALAGTRQTPKLTTRITEDGMTREGSVHHEQELKIDPNKIRNLDPGTAYIISRGRAMRAQVLRAPDVRGELPSHDGPAGPESSEQADTIAPAGGPDEKDSRNPCPVLGGSSEKGVGSLPF